MSTRDSHHSSPHKINQQGYQQFAGNDLVAEERRDNFVLELAGHYVGPVPTTEFLNLLPKHEDPTPYLDCSDVPEGNENDMYQPLHKAIERSGCCPSLIFCDTSGIIDRLTDVKPDGTLLPRSKFENTDKLKKDANYIYAAEVIFELKSTPSHDAFNDRDNDTNKDSSTKLLEALTKAGMKTRGQVIDYATQGMSLQHRTCIFTVCIAGHQARIIRWDRSGAIVSASFDYTEEQFLAEFLWRYHHATPTQRGFDENASLADPRDASEFKREVQKYLANLKDPEHVEKMQCTLEHHYPTYKIRVVDSKTKVGSDYLVRRPIFDALSPTGRATRGYIAWGIKEQELRFLKDTWRTDMPNVMSESQVYELLDALKGPNLPVVCKSGDVEYDKGLQHTLTDEYAKREFAWKRSTVWIRRHVHHRVVQELALPLYMVKSSFQLAKAIRNVLVAIEFAFRKGKLLHRDISAGNVMLTKMFEGILNDWDHVIKLPQTESCHVYRTGTWQYISIALLQKPGKLHAISDDVESTFWLLLNFAWRYFGCKHSSLRAALFDEMDIQESAGGQYHSYGGSKKQTFLTCRHYEEIECKSKPLKRIIAGVGDLLFNIYSLSYLRRTSEIYEQGYQAALAVIQEVTAVIDIFNNAIASDDWPQFADALPDCLSKQTTLQVRRKTVQGYHAAFSHELSKVASSLASSLPQFDTQTETSDVRTTSMGPPTSLPIRSTQSQVAARLSLIQGEEQESSMHISTGSKRGVPNDDEDIDSSTAGPSTGLTHTIKSRKKMKKDQVTDNSERQGEGTEHEGSKINLKPESKEVEAAPDLEEQTTRTRSRSRTQNLEAMHSLSRRTTRSAASARGDRSAHAA